MENIPTPMFADIGDWFWPAVMGVLALIVVSVILSCIKVVKQNQVIVIERFGKYQKTLRAGLNIITPVMDRPRAMMWRHKQTDISGIEYVLTTPQTTIDLREQVFDFAKQNVITADNVTIEIDAMLYFQIMDEKAAMYEIANLPDAIEKLCKTSLRNVAGNMTLDQCLTSRDKINSELLTIMDEATDKWGVKVNRVEL